MVETSFLIKAKDFLTLILQQVQVDQQKATLFFFN